MNACLVPSAYRHQVDHSADPATEAKTTAEELGSELYMFRYELKRGSGVVLPQPKTGDFLVHAFAEELTSARTRVPAYILELIAAGEGQEQRSELGEHGFSRLYEIMSLAINTSNRATEESRQNW